MSSDNQQTTDAKWGETSSKHEPLILSNFVARETDVLITTAPKAGTTWMQQILYQLHTGGDAEFENIYEVIPWLEIQRDGKTWSEIIAEFDKLDAPRIFKTHCTYPQTPGVDIARIILTSRDPRDCCVSFYHHMMNLTDETCRKSNIQKPESFNAYFETWFDVGGWYRNVSSWWPHIDNENILWLRYEDMKLDLEEALDQILSFLGWQLDQESKTRVLEYCSFDWMKKNSQKFTFYDVNEKPAFKPGTFIRKGKTGDHKNLLDKDQEKRILDHAYEVLEPECIAFLKI